MSFTNPAPKVGSAAIAKHLINESNVQLRRHQTTGEELYGQVSGSSCCSLHQEYFTKEESLQSRMPVSNKETWGKFCGVSGRISWYSVSPIIDITWTGRMSNLGIP